MRLGIFGGSFDPVHLGHLLLAECCREQCRLDAVWFLPAAVPPHKQQGRELSPAADRLAMLELAVAGNEAFSVCCYEIDRGGVNYSVDTLTYLHEEDPTRELYFLLGADMLEDLPTWRNARRVCELALPVAVHRPGCAPLRFECLREIVKPDRLEIIRSHAVEMPQIDISSTELRNREQAGQSIRYRVPHAVEMYIASHGLYEPDREPRINEEPPMKTDYCY